MKHGNISFLLAAIVIVLAACSRGGLVPNDPHIINLSDSSTPVVDIYFPAENEVFNSGDTLRVEGKVTDNGLYRGSIKIINDATGQAVKEQLYEVHGLLQYIFQISYKISVPVITNYTITVQFEDHGFNNGVKSVKIRVNP